jgi:hypothetical protein
MLSLITEQGGVSRGGADARNHSDRKFACYFGSEIHTPMSNSLAVNKFSPEREDDIEAHSPVKPERNLLAAVLARAICDAFGTAHCERHIVRSARQWLFGTLMPKQSFSFSWVATHLDLDPVALQETLRNYEGNPEGIQERLALLR